jgi:hypothetical protein
MHSKVLKGFYKSEVYVVGANKEDAIQTGLQAYDQYIEEQLEEYGCNYLLDDIYPDDEFHAEQAKAKREEFHQELKADLKQTKYRGRIDVSS